MNTKKTIEGGLYQGQMAVHIDGFHLTFEIGDLGEFKSFKTLDGKSFGRSYKSTKNKLAKKYGICMQGGSFYACQFMDALKNAKECFKLKK
jgi:hypothetical protein